jgi:transcriptional regulator with XRE-family HTH domain
MDYKKNPQIIGLIIKFVRHKRHLSQQETAHLADINRALISLLESGNVEKSGLKPISLLFSALHINIYSLSDPSLYDLIKKNKIEMTIKEEYAELSDSIIKIYSAVFDAYCAILPWSVNLEIAKRTKQYKDLISSPLIKEAIELKSKIGKGKMDMKSPVHVAVLDYLPSSFVLELLMSFSKKDLLDIFWVADRTFVSNSETLEKKIFNDILSRDPFPLFMKKIGVNYIDYFSIIDLVVYAASEFRKSRLDNFKESAEYVIKRMRDIVENVSN